MQLDSGAFISTNKWESDKKQRDTLNSTEESSVEGVTALGNPPAPEEVVRVQPLPGRTAKKIPLRAKVPRSSSLRKF